MTKERFWLCVEISLIALIFVITYYYVSGLIVSTSMDECIIKYGANSTQCTTLLTILNTTQ